MSSMVIRVNEEGAQAVESLIHVAMKYMTPDNLKSLLAIRESVEAIEDETVNVDEPVLAGAGDNGRM